MKADLAQLSSQLARATAPVHTLIARVPDVSTVPLQRQLAIGLGASLVLHLLIFLALSFLLSEDKKEAAGGVPVPPISLPAQEQLNIQLVTKPKPEIEPRTRLIDRRGMEANAEKPKDAQFESDENMKAGSESAPTGLLPLPSQEGRTDRNMPDFATQNATVGESAALPWPQLTMQPRPAPEAPAPEAPPAPSAEPLYTPNPVAKEALDAASKAAPNDKLPDPSKPVSTPPPRTALATPKPREVVVMPREDQVAVAKPTPRPPAPKAQPRDASPGAYAMLSTPPPLSKKSFTKRFQERLEKNRVEGSISNRGKAGIDSVSTPQGRYWSQAKAMIGSRWYPLTNTHMSLIAPGIVKVNFSIDATGRAQDVVIESNTGNQSLADICERAVRENKFPPPPRELITISPNQRLEFSLSFNFYSL